jgi:hypothetical protein
MTTNPASVLDSVKKVLGFDSEFTDFDVDIIMHVNTFFGDLLQVGAGPSTGFVIEDNTALWTDFTDDNSTYLSNVQSYIYIKVRLVFDTPATSFAIDALSQQATETLWRINTMIEAVIPS